MAKSFFIPLFFMFTVLTTHCYSESKIDVSKYKEWQSVNIKEFPFRGQQIAVKNFIKAIKFTQHGKIDKALEYLKTALKYWNDLPQANKLMAELSELQGDIKSMEKFYRRYLKLTHEDRETVHHYYSTFQDDELNEIEGKFEKYGIRYKKWVSAFDFKQIVYKVLMAIAFIGCILLVCGILSEFFF